MLGDVVVDTSGAAAPAPTQEEVTSAFGSEISNAVQTLTAALPGVATSMIQAEAEKAAANAAAKSAEAQARLAEAQAEKAKAGIPVLSVKGALPTWVIPIAVAAGAVAIFFVLRKK